MTAPTYSEIVARLAAACGEARACLIVSADGLTLGAFPPESEDTARAAWRRVEQVGDPERGFLVVDGETWAFARRAGYRGIVVAPPGARAGLLLDALDRALRQAHGEPHPEAQEPKRTPAPPVRRARATLHREPLKPDGSQAARRDRVSRRADRSTERPAERPAEPAAEPPVVAVDPVELSREFGALLDEGNEGQR